MEGLIITHGEMVERPKAPVLKTGVGKPTVGSNPTLSATPIVIYVGKNYRCPVCSAGVVWSINNLSDGSTGRLCCVNNLNTSSLNWDKKQRRFCTWEGIAKRDKDKVVLLEKDGKTRLRSY